MVNKFVRGAAVPEHSQQGEWDTENHPPENQDPDLLKCKSIRHTLGCRLHYYYSHSDLSDKIRLVVFLLELSDLDITQLKMMGYDLEYKADMQMYLRPYYELW